MPSIARLIGLALLIAAPGILPAQGLSPAQVPGTDLEPAASPLSFPSTTEPGSNVRQGTYQPPLFPPTSQVVPAAQQEDVGQVFNSPKTAEPGQAAKLPDNRDLLPAGDPSVSKAPTPLPLPPPPPAAKQSAPALTASPARPEGQLPLGTGRSAPGNHTCATGNLPALATVGGSLAVVLGLFFSLAWAMRRTAPRGSTILPGEVFEVLGRAPLAARQQVHLLRCGAKLLLVSVTPTGTETLTEVTDPLEVDRLAGLCRQAHPHSATAAFRQVFQQLAPKHRWENEHE